MKVLIAVENLIPLKIFELPRYSQIVQPYMKTTCLWLRGLPPLKATNIVKPTEKWVAASDNRREKRKDQWSTSGRRSAKERSKTFVGIAVAMAEQWGGLE